MDDRLDRLYEDFYIGRGKDNLPMTIRMAHQEDFENMTIERMEKMDSLVSKLTWFSVTTMLAAIGFLIKATFFPHVS